MVATALRRVAHEVKESYRKNQGHIQGLVFRHYPNFVFNGHLTEIKSEIPVFVFHDVESKMLDRQLRYLKDNNYHVLESADALHKRLLGVQRIDPNSVLLTFDDGLESLYRVAFPLLKRYGFHAVSFVVPGFVGKTPFCDWKQIREMQQSGVIDVQSHTLVHRFAPEWPRIIPCMGGEVEQNGETVRYPTMVADYQRAREVIEEHIGSPVRHLCYPNYEGTEAGVAASKTSGHVSNFWGVIPGRNTNKSGDDPFRIVRISDDYLFCLPGRGRRTLPSILQEMSKRYRGRLVTRLTQGRSDKRNDAE